MRFITSNIIALATFALSAITLAFAAPVDVPNAGDATHLASGVASDPFTVDPGEATCREGVFLHLLDGILDDKPCLDLSPKRRAQPSSDYPSTTNAGNGVAWSAVKSEANDGVDTASDGASDALSTAKKAPVIAEEALATLTGHRSKRGVGVGINLAVGAHRNPVKREVNIGATVGANLGSKREVDADVGVNVTV